MQQEFTASSQAFIEKYRVKGGVNYDPITRKVQIHVLNGGHPEDALKVRDLERDGVDDLKQSFVDTGVKLPMEIIGVIWTDHSRLLDINNLQVDFMTPHSRTHIHIICGLHRTTALQELHKVFTKKPLYMYYHITLLIVPRTFEYMQTCLFIGNSDNRKSQVLVKTSQWSVVSQYRRQLEQINNNNSLSAQEKATAFTNYKKRSAPEIAFETNTLHTFSAVASIDSSVFALMAKIFKGEFVVNKALKGQKKPDAVTHFTSMSGIPPPKLCKWLQRILDGEWLTSTFQKRCKIWTKSERVMSQILEYMQTIRPRAKFYRLNDVIKCYPAVGDSTWCDAVINSCEDAVKAKLSQHAIKMIEDMVETKDAADKEKKVCSTFSCCFLNYCFSIMSTFKSFK